MESANANKKTGDGRNDDKYDRKIKRASINPAIETGISKSGLIKSSIGIMA